MYALFGIRSVKNMKKCKHNVELLDVKPGGTRSNRWDLNVYKLVQHLDMSENILPFYTACKTVFPLNIMFCFFLAC